MFFRLLLQRQLQLSSFYQSAFLWQIPIFFIDYTIFTNRNQALCTPKPAYTRLFLIKTVSKIKQKPEHSVNLDSVRIITVWWPVRELKISAHFSWLIEICRNARKYGISEQYTKVRLSCFSLSFCTLSGQIADKKHSTYPCTYTLTTLLQIITADKMSQFLWPLADTSER